MIETGDRLRKYLSLDYPEWPEDGVSPVFILRADTALDEQDLIKRVRNAAVRLHHIDLDTGEVIPVNDYQARAGAFTPSNIMLRVGDEFAILRIDTTGMHNPKLISQFIGIILEEMAGSPLRQIDYYDPDVDQALWNTSEYVRGHLLD